MSSSKKEVYCLAPWVHSYVNTQGRRELCCFKDFNLDETTDEHREKLDDYWNSEKVKNIRLKMLEGEAPESCYPCSSRVLYNLHPRNFFFNKYAEVKELVHSETALDGSTSLRPRFLDYRFSNKCNFSCRMCSPGASSKIEKIERKFRPSDFPEDSFANSRKEFNESHVVREFKELIDSGSLDQIYWGGGEPLVTQEHWEMMDYAIKSGFSKQIELTYNTNLSVLSYQGTTISDLVSHFKSVKFLVSLDAIGEIGEYIREGLSWERMKENLVTISKIPNSEVRLTITITLPGLFGICELANFIIENNFKYDVHICHANGPHDLLTPLILPRNILTTLIDEKVKKLRALDNKLLVEIIENILILKKQKNIYEMFPDNFDDRFFACRSYYLKKEPKVGLKLESILSNNKDVYDWWFREKTLELECLGAYEKKMFKLQSDFIKGKDKVIQYKSHEDAITINISRLSEVVTKSSINGLVCDVLVISNDKDIFKEVEPLFKDLNECISRGGLISLIVPCESFLNRIANYKEQENYFLKTKLDHEISNHRFDGFEIISNESIPPCEFVLLNKGLGGLTFLGRGLDFLWSIFGIKSGLHRQWVLRKK